MNITYEVPGRSTTRPKKYDSPGVAASKRRPISLDGRKSRERGSDTWRESKKHTQPGRVALISPKSREKLSGRPPGGRCCFEVLQ